MSTRYRSSFAAPTGFVAAVTRSKPIRSNGVTILPKVRKAAGSTTSLANTAAKQAA